MAHTHTQKDIKDALSAFLWTLYNSVDAIRSYESLTTTETWRKIISNTEEEML